MKKILIMLSVLGLVHFSANAQVGTGATHNNTPAMKQGDQGQKIDVIEGTKNTANTANHGTQMPMHGTHTVTHSATAYHKSTVHHAVHHTYAKAGMHHTTHHTYAKASMHHATTHKATHAVAMHKPVKHAYSGNRANVYSGSATATMHHETAAPPVDNAKNQNAAVNRKIPDTPYPGASNGGWSNGTNGKGGTNTEDGTIKTERRDN